MELFINDVKINGRFKLNEIPNRSEVSISLFDLDEAKSFEGTNEFTIELKQEDGTVFESYTGTSDKGMELLVYSGIREDHGQLRINY